MTYVHDLLSGSTLQWAPTVTLVFLLACRPWSTYPPTSWFDDFTGTIASVVAMVGLLFPNLATVGWYWFILSMAHVVWIATAYIVADNHHYLFGYWCLAIGIALYTGGASGERSLASSATLLIGLCFLVAVLAKLTSRRYRDGSFFAHRLMVDGRFIALATFVGGVNAELREQHLAAVRRIRNGSCECQRVPVLTRLRRTAIVLTWWTVCIESVVAFAFLLPPTYVGSLRVICLGLFTITRTDPAHHVAGRDPGRHDEDLYPCMCRGLGGRCVHPRVDHACHTFQRPYRSRCALALIRGEGVIESRLAAGRRRDDGVVTGCCRLENRQDQGAVADRWKYRASKGVNLRRSLY
jgi:hypothetical protein